jgi:hypothetical protein
MYFAHFRGSDILKCFRTGTKRSHDCPIQGRVLEVRFWRRSWVASTLGCLLNPLSPTKPRMRATPGILTLGGVQA